MIQRRQDAERERIEIYEATLRRVARRPRLAPDFAKAIDEAACGFSGEVVRDAQSWHPQMKTRDAARLRLAAARHLFALYPVSATLEQIWLDDRGLDTQEVRLRKQWYVVAARGGSLFKAGAGQWLTRKEVHAFLNPPAGAGFNEAIWYAIARSYTDAPNTAMCVARSKIARTPRAEMAFWRDVARFFCANPVPVEAIDDLCDYLGECRRRDPRYSPVRLTARTRPFQRRNTGSIPVRDATRGCSSRVGQPALNRCHAGSNPATPAKHQPPSSEAEQRSYKATVGISEFPGATKYLRP